MKKTELEPSTEEKILTAARNVFIRKGLDGARMQEIADEAGINKALLHYYFRTKEKLYDRILKHIVNKFQKNLFVIFNQDKPFDVLIWEFADKYITFLQQNEYLPIFIVHEMQTNPEKLKKYLNFSEFVDYTKIKLSVQSLPISKKINEVGFEQVVISMIGLCAFPIISKVLFMNAFQMNQADFEKLMDERKKIVPEMILKWLNS